MSAEIKTVELSGDNAVAYFRLSLTYRNTKAASLEALALIQELVGNPHEADRSRAEACTERNIATAINLAIQALLAMPPPKERQP